MSEESKGGWPEAVYMVRHMVSLSGKRTIEKFTFYEQKPAGESVPYIPEALAESRAREERAKAFEEAAKIADDHRNEPMCVTLHKMALAAQQPREKSGERDE